MHIPSSSVSFLFQLSLLTCTWWGCLGNDSDDGGILAVLGCSGTWAGICCVYLPNSVCSGACTEVVALAASELRPINVKDYIHEQVVEGSLTAWGKRGAGASWHSQRSMLAWRHILLKSSFCFIRCIAAGAWSMMFCDFFFFFILFSIFWKLAVTGGIRSPNLDCQRTLSPGWEVKRVGEESSVWGTGIIDYIGGSWRGNSMEISWWPVLCPLCNSEFCFVV